METFRTLGALDTIELVMWPLFFGAGKQPTPTLRADINLVFERARALTGGSDGVIYRCEGQRGEPPNRPASQRPK
jgi:hypothetical protein